MLRVRNSLVQMTGASKVFVAAATDAVLSGALLICAFLLRYGDIAQAWTASKPLVIWAVLLGPVCFYVAGLYREITRYIGPVFAVRVCKGVALLTAAIVGVSFL